MVFVMKIMDSLFHISKYFNSKKKISVTECGTEAKEILVMRRDLFRTLVKTRPEICCDNCKRILIGEK